MTFTTQRYVPTLYTKPLSDNPVSDGPWLREFCDRYIKEFDGKPFQLEDWQADLIDAVLERFPDDWPAVKLRGRIRFRQVIISMGRQNGKSVIGAVLGLWGLFQPGGPHVIGLASKREQAQIVFDRVKKIIDSHPQLSKRFKTTHTRGISRVDKPGRYEAAPAKAEALQGIPVTLCLFDEVHLCPQDMWDAMVLGTTAQPDGMVLGITTAGDDSSVLLKRLYERGQEATGDPHSRFGFFLWQAPEGCRLDDVEALLDANPALASGRLDLDNILEQLRGMPEDEVRRYRFNQFQQGGGSWLPMDMWHRSTGAQVPMEHGEVFFAVDRSESWEFATITANYGDKAGVVHTKVIASIRKPNLEWLLNICIGLNERHWPKLFVMEGGWILSDLGRELKKRGVPVHIYSQAEVNAAYETGYALIATGKVKHNADPLLAQQMPFAEKKTRGDGWRVKRTVNTDAVNATVFGLYAVERNQDEDWLGIVA